MDLCEDCEDKRRKAAMRDALSDLETEIIALKEITDVVRHLDEMPLFLAWSVVEHTEKLRARFNEAWDVV